MTVIRGNMNHDELINNWISMDKAAVDIGLTAEAMSAMSEEITRLRQRAEAAEQQLATRQRNGDYWDQICSMRETINTARAEFDAAIKRAEAAEQERDQLRKRVDVLEEARKNARADADKWALESATQAARAEAAEARVKHLDDMLEMLPEYLEYWNACDGPTLSLSEWYTYRDGYQE